MSEHEFQQALANHRRYRLAPLFESTPVARLLRGAASDLRRREAAQTALDQQAPLEWAGKLSVARVDGDLALLLTEDAAAAERARRGGARLLRILRAGAPQIQRVEIAVAQGAAPAGADANGSESA